MKKYKRKLIYILIFVLLLCCSNTFQSFAHRGRTDSQGGHHDYGNQSGLGSYHYHHGMGPHLHPNGVCPYGGGGGTSSSSTNASSKSQQSDYIEINNYQKTLYVNENANIDFTIYSYYNDFVYEFISSDPSILKVNNKTVTAISAGTANITIKTFHTEKVITITVKEIYAQSLDINVNSNELKVGKKTTIESVIFPDNTTNKNLNYSSSNDDIAIVSPQGIITGISAGTTTITVTTSNNISKTLDIEVYEVFPKEIDCEEKINLLVGESYNFNVKIIPFDANNKEYFVSCDNDEILQCKQNDLYALKEGETIVHVETWNNIKKDIQVNIDMIPVKSVSIKDSTEYIYPNIIDKRGEIVLTPEIKPYNATYQEVKWESSNNNIISIINNKFAINGSGKVTLYCIAYGDITDSIEITVVNVQLILILFLIITVSIILVLIINENIKNKKINP